MKKWLPTAVLAAVALSLWGFVVVVERHWESTSERESSSRVLIRLPEEEVVGLTIRSQAGTAVIGREGIEGAWMFREPVADLANGRRVAELVRELCALKVRERFDEKGPKRPARLGFTPSSEVAVELSYAGGGRKPAKFVFGDEAPFEGTAFVKVESRKNHFDYGMVETPIHPVLHAPSEHLRERRILTIHPGKVRSYVLRTADSEVELEREPDAARWFIKRPFMARANDDIAYSILDELAQMRVESFLDDSAFPLESPLDGSMVKFTITPDQGQPFEIRLREQPGETPEETRLLARAGGRDVVLRVRDDLVSRLPTNLDQLRYPYLMDFNKDAVARIRIRSRSNPDVNILNDGHDWFLSRGGEPEPANEVRIDRLLGALLAEPILEFRSNSTADFDMFGLGRPALEVAITTSSMDADVYDAYQAAIRKARLGGRDPREIEAPKARVQSNVVRFGYRGGKLVNANLAGTPFVFGIDPALISTSLPAHPLKWLGLRVMRFRLFEVQEIEIAEAGSPALKLFYDYLRNEWTGLLGEERVDDWIEPRRAELLAELLGSLEAADHLTTRTEAYRALANPSCVVRIRTSKLKRSDQLEPPPVVERKLLLAAAVKGSKVAFYYGQFEGRPDVFILDGESYNRMMQPVLRIPADPE